MPHETSAEHHLAALAGEPLDAADAHLLATLRRAVRLVDPVPDDLVDRTTFAVALDEVYAEVAELQRGRHLAGVRGDRDTDTATMTFSSEHASMTITATETGRRQVRIDGWLTGPETATIALRLTGETRRAAAERGRFWFEDVPRGQVQLRVEDADGDVHMLSPAVDL